MDLTAELSWLIGEETAQKWQCLAGNWLLAERTSTLGRSIVTMAVVSKAENSGDQGCNVWVYV